MLLKVCHKLEGAHITIQCYSITLDTAGWNLGRIKEDYKALGVQVESIGAQGISSSISPVRGKGTVRNRCITQINFCL